VVVCLGAAISFDGRFMSKRILLFPGQGSQYLGMGQKIAEEFAPAKQLLQQANDILGFDLGQLMANGPEADLTATQNTQPALFTVSMMTQSWLADRGVTFDYVAGHSLGEYSALCAAGVLEFAAGLRLVRLRGDLMAQAGAKQPGAMAAILGLEREKLEPVLVEASKQGLVVAANFNSLSQIVISGTVAGVDAALPLAEAAGAKKVVKLAVSGAFHSPLMEFAIEGLRQGLASVTFSKPRVPVITNVEATATTDANRFADLLLRQLTSPVRWVESIQAAQTLGVTEAMEVGAGKVLMGLVRGISRDIKVTPVESPIPLT
jgi:[acyl-carrier-protein] S-malonyltransferase